MRRVGIGLEGWSIWSLATDVPAGICRLEEQTAKSYVDEAADIALVRSAFRYADV